MNKKILIGSIIAVAVLIGVSFTSVVGYRSVTSDVKASPLFNIRISRAIDEENDDLRCAYVGKGIENNIFIPKRTNKTALIQEVIASISRMDDASFNRFIDLVINYIYRDNKYQDIETNSIITALNLLRRNIELKTNYYIGKDSDSPTGLQCPITDFQGCYFLYFMIFLVVFLTTLPEVIIMIILSTLISVVEFLCAISNILTVG